jgi:hypothetical protein
MADREYNFDKCDFVWNNVDLLDGVAEGAFLSETLSGSSWMVKNRGRGGIIRIRNPSRSGTLALTVDREDKLHQRLVTLSRADRAGGQIVADMIWRDSISGETVTWHNAFILTEPGESKSTNAGATAVWVFQFGNKTELPITDLDANVIGN